MLEYSKYWNGFLVHLFWVLGDEVILKKIFTDIFKHHFSITVSVLFVSI